MAPSSRRCAAMLAVTAAVALPSSSAGATSLLTPPPPPTTVVAPVAAAISADPVGRVRGTIILVHAGGWAGHDAYAQQQLMQRPGALLLQRGWRVVSIDYTAGSQGLQDILDATGAELARRSSNGPLCLYGESAGGHLALVAAARLRAIDCVITIGAPTDLGLYQAEAAANPDERVKLVASQAMRHFGTTPAELAPWNAVALAAATRADILLLHERDDPIVSAQHALRLQAARPTTEIIDLEAGAPNEPSPTFMHASVSSVGHAVYTSALNAFTDRAERNHTAERAAARTGCTLTARSIGEIGPRRLRHALRCLALKHPRPTSKRSWTRTRLHIHGAVNAARIYSALRRTPNGRHALHAIAKQRATITVHTAQRSRITVRHR
jgi:acetyl esterase/lipase